MPAIRKLLKETKTFLEMLERNGGTLGGYYMQAQYIQLQIAIKNTEKELADE